jgi:hypothetical protein
MAGTSRSNLPEWMLNPPPPRLTLMQRLTAPLTRQPAWRALQQRWWRWQDRTRLHESHPTAFKIVAVFASWVLIMVMLAVVYLLFALAMP